MTQENQSQGSVEEASAVKNEITITDEVTNAERQLRVPNEGSLAANGSVSMDAAGNAIQVKVGNSVLDVPNFDPRALAISVIPEKESHIATSLAKVVVPVLFLDIFNVPGKLLSQLELESQKMETLLPLDALEIMNRIEAYTLKTGHASLGRIAGVGNPLDRFSFEAVKDSQDIIHDFLRSVKEMCVSVCEIKKRKASFSSVHFEKAMGGSGEVSAEEVSSILLSPVDEFVLNMNQMGSGKRGWVILSLIQNVKEIATFIANPNIVKAYGCSKPLAVLNKLDCRINPSQQLFHDQLCQLMQVVHKISDEKTADLDLQKVLMMKCESVLEDLNKLNIGKKK